MFIYVKHWTYIFFHPQTFHKVNVLRVAPYRGSPFTLVKPSGPTTRDWVNKGKGHFRRGRAPEIDSNE